MTQGNVSHELRYRRPLLARRERVSYAEADMGRITRREHKHDMLITFMANATKKRKRRTALIVPKLLKAILSVIT